MGDFLNDARKKAEEIAKTENVPYVGWGDLDEDSMMLVGLHGYEYRKEAGARDRSMTFSNLYVPAVKVYDGSNELVLHWNIYREECKNLKAIKVPGNDWLNDQITDADGADVMMITNHRLVTMKNGKKFHKCEPSFYHGDKTDAYKELYEGDDPILSR